MPPPTDTTQARSSQNAYISTSDGATPTPVLTEIIEVMHIGGPNEKADEIDVTHLRSPGGYREFIASFKDGGELPLELNFIPGDPSQDSVTGLRSEFQQLPIPIKIRVITFPDGTTATFKAWVKNVGTDLQVGNAMKLNVTLRIVGPTTWVEFDDTTMRADGARIEKAA